MKLFNSNTERRGLLGTLMFHALLLLAFLFYGMSYWVPPPPIWEATGDFGFNEAGLGEAEDDPAASETEQQSSSAESGEDIETQDVEDAVEISQNDNPVDDPVEDPVEEPVEDPEPVISDELKALQDKYRKGKEDAKSGGNTTGTGNEGGPDGEGPGSDPGAPGSGDDYLGRYRKLVSKARPKNDCPIGGSAVTIKMEIIVDRTGTIIRANPIYKESNSTDPCMIKRAREAAKKSKWSADPEAPPEQKGYFTYKFKPI